MVLAFAWTGFRGANAWYLKDGANAAYADEAPRHGVIDRPVLFLHAAFDTVCDTVRSNLPGPIREDVDMLAEITIDAGHTLMLKAPDAVKEAVRAWLFRVGLMSGRGR